jgi:hypothetical protein
MGFESDSSEFERISTKKLAILFGLLFLGAFMVIQMVQGFPLADLLFRQTTTEQVNVSLKQEDVCVVEAADGQPMWNLTDAMIKLLSLLHTTISVLVSLKLP